MNAARLHFAFAIGACLLSLTICSAASYRAACVQGRITGAPLALFFPHSSGLLSAGRFYFKAFTNSSFTDGSGFFAVRFTLRGVPSSSSSSSLTPLGISFQLQSQIIQPVFGFDFTVSDSPATTPGNRFGYKTIIASGSQLLGPTDFEYVHRCFQAASVGAMLLTSSAGPTAVGYYRSVPAAVRCKF